MQLSFGRFVLDEGGRTLLLDGRELPLQPLVFDLLVLLIRERARVVPKEELLALLWGDTVVTDGSLQRAVSLLRPRCVRVGWSTRCKPSRVAAIASEPLSSLRNAHR